MVRLWGLMALAVVLGGCSSRSGPADPEAEAAPFLGRMLEARDKGNHSSYRVRGYVVDDRGTSVSGAKLMAYAQRFGWSGESGKTTELTLPAEEVDFNPGTNSALEFIVHKQGYFPYHKIIYPGAYPEKWHVEGEELVFRDTFKLARTSGEGLPDFTKYSHYSATNLEVKNLVINWRDGEYGGGFDLDRIFRPPAARESGLNTTSTRGRVEDLQTSGIGLLAMLHRPRPGAGEVIRLYTGYKDPRYGCKKDWEVCLVMIGGEPGDGLIRNQLDEHEKLPHPDATNPWPVGVGLAPESGYSKEVPVPPDQFSYKDLNNQELGMGRQVSYYWIRYRGRYGLVLLSHVRAEYRDEQPFTSCFIYVTWALPGYRIF